MTTHRTPQRFFTAALMLIVLSVARVAWAYPLGDYIDDFYESLAQARALVAARKDARAALARLRTNVAALRHLKAANDPEHAKAIKEAEELAWFIAPMATAAAALGDLEHRVARSRRAREEKCADAEDALSRMEERFAKRPAVTQLRRRYVAAGCASKTNWQTQTQRPVYYGPDRFQVIHDCVMRCRQTTSACEGSCICGGLANETPEQTGARCQMCRANCEQNERFCRVSCGE